MEFILNELSLNGQFSDMNDFSENGVRPLSEVLSEIRVLKDIKLLKKSDFNLAKVTATKSFHEIIFSQETRCNDRMRRMKGILASLENNPFWDENPIQKTTGYKRVTEMDIEDVSGSGVAEAYEREACLVSFCHSGYETSPVKVKSLADDKTKEIENIHKSGQATDVLYNAGESTVEEYIKSRFKSKLDFSQIDPDNGFNLIDNQNESTFISCFTNFENKTWQQIMTDDALDYKQFSYNRKTRRFFDDSQWSVGIHKFRIDSEKRCFGYREGELFHVLRFDLNHKLSDLG